MNAAPLPFACTKCGAPHERYASACSCGAYNSIRSAMGMGHYEATNGGAQILNTATSEMPPEVPRKRTGHVLLDIALGGGLVLETKILLAGEAGVGKTTMLLEWLGMIATNLNLRCVYISAEQISKLLLGEVRRRLGVQHANFSIAQTSDVAEANRIASGFDVAVFDSIQAFHALPEHFPRPATRIFVSRINKSGEILGVTDQEHDPDVVLFAVHADDLGDEVRSVYATKNRYAATGNKSRAHYTIEESGTKLWLPPPPIKTKKRKKADEHEQD